MDDEKRTRLQAITNALSDLIGEYQCESAEATVEYPDGKRITVAVNVIESEVAP